ncbi:hypothetical protein M3202_15255 [Alkalihalobacillus oceani]|uniref:Uncharacterized protein n=1 Tax=Halalkalibacter oceani TaxID=1653776 RepID=A0A9X2DS24_9BACI|nr:hypothetical protein [Halalkalibacter oceani]MCM3715428.1 hypothetical protein [Halalkalibacter oceani]
MDRQSYSEIDLIGQELKEYTRERPSFLGFCISLLEKKRMGNLKIRVPKKTLKRAIAFCKDVERIIEEPFQPAMIIDILLDEFLLELAKKNDVFNIFRNLRSRNYKPIEFVRYNALNSELLQGSLSYNEITLELKRDDILRIEWMLDDLEEQYANHGFTVETVIEILFCDFIEEYRKGGMPKAVDRIIRIYLADE